MAGPQEEEEEQVTPGEPAHPIQCPECGSPKTWRDGRRTTNHGVWIQRYLCRSCGYRFSEKIKKEDKRGPRFNPICNKGASPGEMQEGTNQEEPHNPSLNINVNYQGLQAIQEERLDYLYPPPPSIKRRVCAGEVPAKNSAAAEPAGMGENMATAEPEPWKKAVGDISAEQRKENESGILDFLWWMKRQGYADETIRGYVLALKVLVSRGADLSSPESVKEVIARQRWSGNRRKNVINAYSLFLKMRGWLWEKPRCDVEQKIPFIPTEQELDALIAGSNKKLAAFLRLLKETGMRAGEAVRLEWTDVDFERRLVTLNRPEKRSNPRMWRVSGELMGMVGALPRRGVRVFDVTYNNLKNVFLKTRRRLAYKLQNPRLLKITFHTFRHWRATMLYHQTKDPYYVKQFLGHKSIMNTERYITIERTLFGEYSDEFTVRVASRPEEIKELLETGFEYVCTKDELMFFRKRK